jgi:signal transduction histidine kinase
MEQKEKYLIFVVVSSTILVLLLIAVVVDLIFLYQSKKRMAEKEIEIEKQKVDELLRKHEIENVNKLLQGQYDERKRISKELHDRLGNKLFGIKINYKEFAKNLQPFDEPLNDSYLYIADLLNDAIAESRRISHDLYDSSMGNINFKEVLMQLIKGIEEGTTLKINFDDGNVDLNKYPEIQKELLPITQELLSNTLKHAKASRVVISIRQLMDELIYTYSDNGIGILVAKMGESDGIGLKNMKERAKKINGILNIQNNQGKGMTCMIKLKNEPHEN